MSGFFDYNGDGVVNQQDDIDYWDDRWFWLKNMMNGLLREMQN